MRLNAIRINENDNVAVALEDIPAGGAVRISSGEQFAAVERIPFAHKVAIRAIAGGEAVVKYGVPIAFAKSDVARGGWVHSHNAKSYWVEKRQ
jgi:altronate hydrolase